MTTNHRAYLPQLRARTDNLIRLVMRHKWKIAIGLVALLFYINATSAATAVFFVIVLTALGAISTIYKLNMKISFGFELVTMATVLTTLAYGPIIGAFVGLISSILAEILPQMIESSSIFWISSTALSAFLVAFVHVFTSNLMVLGLTSFALQMLISEPVRLMGPPEIKVQGLLYITTGLAWNIFVFAKIAPFVLSLMQ